MSEWKEYILSEVLDLISGGKPKTSIPEYWSGDIPWLSVSDFNNGRKYMYQADKSITQLGLSRSSTNVLRKGQLIISARGTVGVISMLGIIKRTLRQFGYPPDMQKLATETVLKQAELIANELTNE